MDNIAKDQSPPHLDGCNYFKHVIFVVLPLLLLIFFFFLEKLLYFLLCKVKNKIYHTIKITYLIFWFCQIDVILLLYIYIYIYMEIGSSYTWCNFIIITHFLNHWFQKDLMVKNASLNVYYFWHPYLINCIFFFSLFLSLFIPLQIPPH